MKQWGLIAILTFSIAGAASARSLDIDLSNDSIQARYVTFAGDTTGLGNSELDLGVLYSSSNAGNGDDSLLGMLGLLVTGDAGSGSPGLSVGVGFKLFGGSVDGNSLAALAVSGQLRYHPQSLGRLGLTGQLHYAPNIVTFIDADRFSSVTARVEYEVHPQAIVYLGYRKVWADLSQGPNVDLDNGGHIGLQILF